MGKSGVDESYRRFGGVRFVLKYLVLILTRLRADIQRKTKFTSS